MGHSYLILFDYYSKWLEILKIKNKTAQDIAAVLKNCFAMHDIPEMLVADNMPFHITLRNLRKNLVFKLTSKPNYPKSNWQAENGVKIAKSFLRKQVDLDSVKL